MAHEGGHDDDHGHAHSHAHDHAHAHAHYHDHYHDHDHDHARAALAAGAGRGKLLYFDAFSGLAGDMIIAALVDLGVPLGVVEAAVAALPLTGFHLHVGTRTRSGIVATAFDVHVEGAQPERTYGAIRAILDAAPLPDAVRARAHRAFRKLAEAEAAVHRASLDDVHFHEVGAVDALVDIVGSAAALEHLGANVAVSPLPMGRGFVKARHGTLPLPAPAVVSCLAGFATFDAGVDFEFVTPTGAAIVAANASGSSRWPSLAPERVGWGAGTAELKDRPNLLRVVLGVENAAHDHDHDHVGRTRAPTHAVLEANLDDATGELLAYCIEQLFAAGAVDAWATPITMKKGRPAVTLSALAPLAFAEAVTVALLRESTSLGVRRHDVSRVERPRRMIEVATPFGPIAVKVAEGAPREFGPPQIKPEFDVCAAAARRHGVPVREVMRAAAVAAVAAAAAPPTAGDNA